MSSQILIEESPKLRFPEFGGGWKKMKLGEILQKKNVRNEDKRFSREDVLSVSGDVGIVNQIKHLGRSYAGKDLSNYHVVEFGDIVYTKSPIKNNPYGVIKANTRKAGIVSTLYAVYEVVGDNDFNFVDKYFELDDRTNKYLRPLVHIGAKNDMKISNDRVLIDPVYFPKLEEQRKIVNFFKFTDKLIENLIEQKLRIENYRNWVMEMLFSQSIRFKDSKNKDFPKWEEKKLGEMFIERKERNGSQNYSMLSVTLNKGVIPQKNTVKKGSASKDKSNYKVVHKGDIVYNTMRMWQGASGVSSLKGIVSPAYTVVRPNKGDVNFFKHLFKYPRTIFDFYRYSQGLTSDTWNLKFAHFSEVTVIIPKSITEQQKIAELLTTIYNLIDLKQKEIEKAKTLKKGLLQKMFV